nr:hypothetical protein [Tanacetum cinerariifolium]
MYVALQGSCSQDAKSRLREAGSHEEIVTSMAWIRALYINEPIYAELFHEFYSTYEFDKVCTDDELQTRNIIKSRLGGHLDTTMLRDLIDSDGKLIPEDPQPGVPRVGVPKPPRASVQDLYDRMGRMEIRQEAIERMEYRQSYH